MNHSNGPDVPQGAGRVRESSTGIRFNVLCDVCIVVGGGEWVMLVLNEAEVYLVRRFS